MARCGCASALCTCSIIGDGDNASVTGTGSPTNPYIVSVTPAVIQGIDSMSVDMNITGAGTVDNPYLVSAYTPTLGTQKSATGIASVTGISAVDTPVSLHVNFPTSPSPGFAVAPVIVVSPKATSPHVWSVSSLNETTTGFDLYVSKSSGAGTSLNVSWHAIGA